MPWQSGPGSIVDLRTFLENMAAARPLRSITLTAEAIADEMPRDDNAVVRELGPVTSDMPAHVSRTMRASIFEGSLTNVFVNWTTGSVLTGYLLSLGASPLQLSLLASLPLLAQACNPLALYMQSFSTSRRFLVALTAGVGRGIWLLAVLAPFLFTVPQKAVNLILLVVAVSSILQSLAGLFWTSWMADVVPMERRGRYFGLRNGVIAIAGVAAMFFAGFWLDTFRSDLKFPILIGLSLLFAAGANVLYYRHWEPAAERRTERPSLRRLARHISRDRNFRRLALFIVWWQGSVLVAAPFVYPYFIDYLGLTFTQIALWAAGAAVLTLIFGQIWGRLADRIGNKPILTITTLIAGTVLPASWMLSTPDNYTPLFIGVFFEALAWSAINPAVFNLTLATADKDERLGYLAMLGIFAGGAGFAGASLAGILMEGLYGNPVTIAGIMWTSYHTIFLISALLRCCAWWFLRPVQEVNSWTTWALLNGIRRWRLTGFGWR